MMHQYICPSVAACEALRGHVAAASLHAAHMPTGRGNPILQSLGTVTELVRNCAEHNGCGESVKLETAEGTIGL